MHDNRSRLIQVIGPEVPSECEELCGILRDTMIGPRLKVMMFDFTFFAILKRLNYVFQNIGFTTISKYLPSCHIIRRHLSGLKKVEAWKLSWKQNYNQPCNDK